MEKNHMLFVYMKYRTIIDTKISLKATVAHM